jgi:general secretion pathway protein K
VLHLHAGDATIAVVDEGGRIDLNGADQVLLEGLFEAVRGESMSAQAFAARIVDWRDEDEDVTNDGAEAGTYAESGLSYAPSNRPFHSVEELRFLLELSPADYGKLRPYLTVFSGSAGVDPLNASPVALRAIPYLSDSDLDRIMKARRDGADRREIIDQVPDAEEFLLAESSGVYRVTVQARLSNGYSEAVEAVIISPDEDSADFRVVAWSKLAPETRTQ